MWPITRALHSLLKLIAPVLYLWKKKKNGIALIRFGEEATFKARANTLDALALYEIWRFGAYKGTSIIKGDTVVDIGAHIGGYAVFAARQGASVIAYEPMPETYGLLRNNLAINKCTGVKTYNEAVGSKIGSVVLNVDSVGTTLNSIYSDAAFSQAVRVPLVDLHKVFTKNHIDRIDMLKLDVEGAEYDILLNAQPADLRKVQTIILEYHDHFSHGHSKQEIIAHLKRNGFTVRDLSLWVTTAFFRAGRLLATRPKQDIVRSSSSQ